MSNWCNTTEQTETLLSKYLKFLPAHPLCWVGHWGPLVVIESIAHRAAGWHPSMALCRWHDYGQRRYENRARAAGCGSFPSRASKRLKDLACSSRGSLALPLVVLAAVEGISSGDETLGTD